MKVTFEVKYGKNILELLLSNGTVVSTEFYPKYGRNVVIFPTNEYTAIEFELKYGINTVEVDLPRNVKSLSANLSLSNLWNSRITIYNAVILDGSRTFRRFVVNNCNIQGGYAEKINGTVQNIVNVTTVVTKDVNAYKTPAEYSALPINEKERYYTVQPDDFIVFSKVDDIVESAPDFAKLRAKYKDCGMNVSAVNAYIFGVESDNVTITGA